MGEIQLWVRLQVVTELTAHANHVKLVFFRRCILQDEFCR